MKKMFLISAVVLVVLIGSALLLMKKVHSPCDRLKDISNDAEALSMLFEKMTFYFTDPTYLNQYEVIRSYPTFVTRFSTEIDHGLNIDWKSLEIEPADATFSFKGKPGSEALDYRNINAREVSIITVGIGARFHLLFEIEDDASNPEYYSNRSLVKYNVKVECHK